MADARQRRHPSRRGSVVTLGSRTPPVQPKKRWFVKAIVDNPAAEQVVKWTECKPYNVVMIFATLFALFGVDIYMLLQPSKDLDEGLYIVVFFVTVMFVGEWILFFFCKAGYPFGFFFWLDFLAWLSLIPDILLLFDVSFFDAGGSLTFARAGRAARAGTRAARIVRVVKLLAVMRKSQEANRKETEVEKELEEAQKPSRVGTKLSDLITQKVIVIVGVMLIVSSLLDLIVGNPDATFGSSLENLEDVYSRFGPGQANPGVRNLVLYNEYFAKYVVDLNTKGDAENYRQRMQELQDNLLGGTYPSATNWLTNADDCRDQNLLYVRLKGQDVWCFPESYDHLRKSPNEYILVTTAADSEMVVSNTDFVKGTAWVNLVTVSFVILLLLVSASLFQRDADMLIIGPLEKMAKLVRDLSKNPLATIVEEDEEVEYETDFVESALRKFGKLLQIAFGEAGSTIIARSLGEGGGDIDPLKDGLKMTAIFGFCDIRNFTDCTECLQEDVMVFVNRIAHYVHHAVKDNLGAANKNIGDAFLLVWRLPDSDRQPAAVSNSLLSADDEDLSLQEADNVFDHALMSFIRIIMETSACPDLKQMTDNPKIQERIPGYRVRMGFGLHVGWAVEGAIGSMHKIDASYLSPNVNMAARLEAATKQFRTTILMSGDFVSRLSSSIKSLCRHIDTVTVKGSIKPMELYTYDVPVVEASSLEEVEADPDLNFFEQFAPATATTYRREFHQAVQQYIAGNWQSSSELLEHCLAQWADDGPAQTLLEVLKESNCQAPASWPGYRELVEK